MIRLLVALALASGGAVKPAAVDAGLRIASLNTANGAGDRYRGPAVRARQSELLGDVQPLSLERYAMLADAPLEELAAHNRDVRATARIEARAVVVVRLVQPKLSLLALHLEADDEGPLRHAQLAAAVAIAKAERAKGRFVVVLEDFNMQPSETGATFTDGGFSRAVGEGLNQIWVDATLRTSEAVELPTDGGSDHPLMPVVFVRP